LGEDEFVFVRLAPSEDSANRQRARKAGVRWNRLLEKDTDEEDGGWGYYAPTVMDLDNDALMMALHEPDHAGKAMRFALGEELTHYVEYKGERTFRDGAEDIPVEARDEKREVDFQRRFERAKQRAVGRLERKRQMREAKDEL
jgi:hypothetical protein